jgi:hypothetical protein
MSNHVESFVVVQRSLIDLDAKCEFVSSQLMVKWHGRKKTPQMIMESLRLSTMATSYNHHFVMYSRYKK